MKKLLLFLPLLLLSAGCAGLSGIAQQLKDDPANVDMSVTTPWGSSTFHRSFPTNWVPPAVVKPTTMNQERNTMNPSIGRIVWIGVRPSEGHDPAALQADPIAAVVTRVHNATCINATALPDGSPPQVLSSVCFGTASQPGGHFWVWPERAPELPVSNPAGGGGTSS